MSAVRVTITLPERIVAELEGFAREWQTSRSDAVARVIENYRRLCEEAEMIEGYRSMAGETAGQVEETLAAQREVVLGANG